jgi:hypothetical protein
MLLAATDIDIPLGVPGFSLHEELVRLVEAGLTPFAVLQAATLNPARVLGLADSLGTIGEGLHPAVLVALEDLVAGLPQDPELGAEGRHFLTLIQAGHKPHPLVHDVTLLPGHAPS